MCASACWSWRGDGARRSVLAVIDVATRRAVPIADAWRAVLAQWHVADEPCRTAAPRLLAVASMHRRHGNDAIPSKGMAEQLGLLDEPAAPADGAARRRRGIATGCASGC